MWLISIYEARVLAGDYLSASWRIRILEATGHCRRRRTFHACNRELALDTCAIRSPAS